jgi:hypothetical protein
VKAAVSDIGPPIVIVVGLVVPEKEPVPEPVQPLKLKPDDGIALIDTLVPLFFQPLIGLTFPPAPAVIVRKY